MKRNKKINKQDIYEKILENPILFRRYVIEKLDMLDKKITAIINRIGI